ncbi:hypothetical protein SLEP1_g11116 [Rubroshorea leprosula]|uniref:Uncharacterized protein n=1 Tax=Rubroshorea leprosula TaxID=152421 RepID=A0AAV5ILM6_9ROSI|nr:hypothetical protein SLEP1_g11116 [Rubroshorea leprosula]
MSSKETLSIEGNEELRMLEYNDISIESESSGSERTEGGVGRNEVVEVGAEEGLPPLRDGRKNFFFVDDTEWDRGDAEVEFLSTWKAKKANQNKYSLNSDEEEEVEKLVRREGDIIDIMFLTSSDVIEAAEFYGSSALSEAEMDMFLNAAGDGHLENGQMSSTEPQVAEEVELRSKRKRDEVDQAQKKKRRMEEEVRGDKVVEFVPHLAPVELDPDLRETENFINAFVPEVDHYEAREEVLLHRGTLVVRHALETATWVNALAQEFLELVKEHNNLQKERDELLKKNGEMKRELDIVVPAVTSLQKERDTLKTILSFEEKKRRMCEEENEAQEEEIRRIRESEVELKKKVQLLVHNGMEEHIGNFINSGTFDNVEGVEENGESLSADFQPQIKLRWDHDEEGGSVFPPNFDFEFVAVVEEEGEAEGAEVEKSQPPPPVEVHLVPSKEQQPLLPAEQ